MRTARDACLPRAGGFPRLRPSHGTTTLPPRRAMPFGLQWMHIAVLIMLTGLGLLTGSSIVVGVSQKECMTDSLCAASKVRGRGEGG